MGHAEPTVVAADPFDLPDWLGTGEVTWRAESGVRGSSHVAGRLSAGADSLGCDLLAADMAFPEPVLGEPWRRSVHQAWAHGQVLVVEYGGRLTLAAPGTEFSADLVLELLSRLARAVGVPPDRYVVALRL